MKVKCKVKLFALVIVILLGLLIWILVRPVKIIAVHKKGEFASVLVENFPLSDRGKMNWWLKNQKTFTAQYGIPAPAKDGYFFVTFWRFGDGYKEEGKYDRLCFDDMTSPKNCIEKDAVFSVSHSRNLGTVFTTYEGRYKLQENGEIVADQSTFEAR
ncbi:DUF943 family protein [Serratia rhizosphaerae]|uniref:DUF943 family protein n=1 Tax=Serratia TaxID=613 RepID=UPI000CF6EC8F|nr:MULTISPECIES: DUF943 family protein [Serratia]MBU3895197.1 DUF943 family protein [Serratia rubidaea]AVJ19149.1 hypothetical protein CLM71_19440 [Serratia sp. MYb239]MEB6337357.1 DUF943 family protein [Serratia rhizosphaerae]QNK34728.1 DUF943 family protein [Serratia sp. JUb9]QPT15641.1 DUF943 family protein [Serratia rubidaea]